MKYDSFKMAEVLFNYLRKKEEELIKMSSSCIWIKSTNKSLNPISKYILKKIMLNY